MDPRSRARRSPCHRVACLATLIVAAACSSGESGAPLVLPAQPVEFATAPGRGLARPWTIVPLADGQTLLVFERAAGRVALVDLNTGAIVRLDSPLAGVPVEAVEADPIGGGAFAVVGHAGEPQPPYGEPVLSGAVYRFGAARSEWQLVLERGFAGSGFFVDSAGAGAFTWRDGVDRIDFADGGRERLDGCADFPAALIDPSGRATYQQAVIGPGPHTGSYANLSRCERETEETIVQSVGYRQEALAIGCGGTRLFRAHESFSGATAEGTYATVLYDAFDPTTLDRLDSFDTTTAISELRAPGGPATAVGDCTSVWFGTPSGVFQYDTATREARRIAEGGAGISHVAQGDRPGSAFVFGGPNASRGPFRVDLGTGAFEDLLPGGSAFGEPVSAFTSAAGGATLWLTVSPTGFSYFPPYRLGDARVDALEVATGRITKGITADRTHVSDVSSCEAGRLFALGTEWSADGIETADVLYELRDRALVRVRTLGPTSDAAQTFMAGPGNGRLVMSRDCSTAYILGDRLYAAPIAGHGLTVLDAFGSNAMTLDPRQDLLVLASGQGLYGIDLRDGAFLSLSHLTEPVGDLAVNADGSVAITGVTSLGLGVIDLVAETSARLWEGAGLEGL
ncbi:MAG: hypothetical protein U0610_00260 [bacterium]